MFEIIHKLKKEHNNHVYVIQNKSDLKNISEISENKILKDKVLSLLEGKKSTKLDIFIWEKHCENIFLFILAKKDESKLVDFVSTQAKTLPKNFTFCVQNDKNLSNLLKSLFLSNYSFDEYKSKSEEKKYSVFIDKSLNKTVELEKELIENICLARDLGETPSNFLYPESFAKIVKNTKWKNTKIKILTPKQIEKKWLWLLHAVWKWSVHKPYVVIMERIIDKKLPTIWIVWKWVTFDTGGIQVKPGDHMYEMKWDMWGSASVFATMKQLDNKDLNVNIIAAIWLAENHISGESYKPSDIITAYNGKTVDIIHTDAEWRLVMADVMSYISNKYKLDNLMSVATLTGACMVALGFRYAWIMWNDEEMIENLLEYSKNHEEKYNRLPFDDYFVSKTKWKIADLENLNRWTMAGSSMAAAFLSNFCDNNEKYTHLDIAGVWLNSYEPYGYVNQWNTGFWVESLSTIFQNIK